MNRIPEDIDAMMWQIAERRDENAAAEFSNRFPKYSQDMANRMRMVGGLKQARAQIAPAYIPPFSFRYLSQPKPLWRRYGPAALGLAALASASFYITQNLVTPLPEPEPIHVPAWTPRQVPPPARPAVTAPKSDVRYNPEGPHPLEIQRSPSKNQLHLSAPTITLKDALAMIAAKEKLTLQIPPDFPNPTIERLDIRGSSGMDLIKQLAARHHFTAFDEGRGNVLLIPATAEPAPEQQ